ncbi:MAG: hypothetical protein WA771_01710 [Chthoniobacterales bacterium]
MKLPILSSLIALGALGASYAGSFGGPGPFTNLSPLQSGIDGSYQATARGENLTGVLRFAYQNGVQTQIPGANTYVIFVNGNVVSGNISASITGKDLAGVLGGQDFNIPTNDTGGVELPAVIIVRGNRANGFFEGRLDLEDRLSAFHGEGQITSAPTETNQIIFVDEFNNDNSIIIDDGGDNVTINPFVVPSGNIEPDPTRSAVDFEFQGVRNSTLAQGSFVGGTTATNDTSN